MVRTFSTDAGSIDLIAKVVNHLNFKKENAKKRNSPPRAVTRNGVRKWRRTDDGPRRSESIVLESSKAVAEYG